AQENERQRGDQHAAARTGSFHRTRWNEAAESTVERDARGGRLRRGRGGRRLGSGLRGCRRFRRGGGAGRLRGRLRGGLGGRGRFRRGLGRAGFRGRLGGGLGGRRGR